MNVVLFASRCDGGRFGVQFYIRENLFRLPGCKSGLWDLCDWSIIKEKYRSISQNCDL